MHVIGCSHQSIIQCNSNLPQNRFGREGTYQNIVETNHLRTEGRLLS